jgi:hypothetical protein
MAALRADTLTRAAPRDDFENAVLRPAFERFMSV